MSIVDGMDIPVGEKMLRLQSSLTGKALTLVKDLGFSINAYKRGKEKLEKYGGERRLQMKHLTALRGWQKVRPRNLEDMENFQGILGRVWIALKDCGPGQELQRHNLNLTAKEKLSEEDVQAYKHWLIDHSLEDSFESLIEWVEIRVQIMEEAREEMSGFGKRKSDEPEGQRNGFRSERVCSRTFNTKSKSRSCIVEKCKQNHPPWVCKAFKELPVLKREELIGSAKRCYRCLTRSDVELTDASVLIIAATFTKILPIISWTDHKANYMWAPCLSDQTNGQIQNLEPCRLQEQARVTLHLESRHTILAMLNMCP